MTNVLIMSSKYSIKSLKLLFVLINLEIIISPTLTSQDFLLTFLHHEILLLLYLISLWHGATHTITCANQGKGGLGEH